MSASSRLLLLLVLAITGASCVAEPSATDKTDSAFRWIDRPWEYRYLLQVVDVKGQKSYAELGSKYVKNESKSQYLFSYFNPALTIALHSGSTDSEDAFAITRIDVAKDRTVLTPNTAGLKLEARLTRTEDIVLAPAVDRPEFVINFGEFFMGTYAAANPTYSPTICSGIFGDGYSRGSSSGRYVAGKEPGSDGYFGCREWAAQLYAKDRPYIDVTSYEMEEDYSQDVIKKGKRKGKYPLIPVTYVRPFIGFARYDDPPKPVIGNHKGTWACFNDCPDGDAPGIIPDIKAWAAKHNWPVPKKPKNVREFMDKKPDATDLME